MSKEKTVTAAEDSIPQRQFHFDCSSCSNPLNYTLDQVRRKVSCPKCDKVNVVPMPPMNFEGLRSLGRTANQKKFDGAEEVSEGQPREDVSEGLNEVGDVDAEAKAAADHKRVSQSSGDLQNADLRVWFRLVAMIIVFCFAAIAGWIAVPALTKWSADRISGSPESSVDVGDAGGTATPQPRVSIADLEKLVWLHRRAVGEYVTIVEDYQISLAEAESRGMSEPARRIRRALERSQSDIADAQASFVDTVLSIYEATGPSVEPFERGVEEFIEASAARLSEQEQVFLQETVSAVRSLSNTQEMQMDEGLLSLFVSSYTK
ncbi:MAG: hypothetical protein PsegKO_34680 [Pseudohongiellaceae bacterium]